MVKNRKWIIAATIVALLVVMYLAFGRGSGDTTSGQRFNANMDNAKAAAVRVLDLPLFVLLGAAGVCGVLGFILIERLGGRRANAGRVGIAAVATLTLFTLAVVADRKIGRLQSQVNDLHGKLNANFMAMPDEVVVAAPTPLPSVASTAPAAAPRVIANVAKPLPLAAIAPATLAVASAPASAATKSSAARDKLLIDVDAVKKSLAENFTNAALRPVILDRASDIVEIKIGTPQVVAYLSITDLKTPGVEVQFGGNLSFKTFTTDFAKTNNCAIAINGEAGQSPQASSGLGPWHGNMMSAGKTLLKETPDNLRPFLTFDQQSQVSFTAQASNDRAISKDAYNVIWGRLDALIDGTVQAGAERDRQPRTAMGIDKDNRLLYMLIVDGRQNNYSIGFTRAEVGQFLKAFGAHNGMLCDEGGSSCIYVKKFNGVINSPSDGEERATYTHFGISLRNAASQ